MGTPEDCEQTDNQLELPGMEANEDLPPTTPMEEVWSEAQRTMIMNDGGIPYV